jgi:hypothetical protein
MTMHDLPSSNSECGSSSWVRASRGKGGVADGRARGDRGRKLDDGDIAIKGVRVEARVGLDRGNLDDSSARVPVLRNYQSLLILRVLQARATYQGSGADADAGSRVGDTAVAGSNDSVRVEERTTADLDCKRLARP